MQPLKALFPMLVTDSGILMEAKLVQPLKAPPPMIFTEFGIVTDTRLVQPVKELEPMDVTVFGISMEVKLLQPKKADDAILVVELSVTLVRFLQSRNISGTIFETVTEVRPVQPVKISSPKLVTDSGIVMDFRFVQPLKT